MTLPFDVLRLLRKRLETAAWLAGQLELTITRQSQTGNPYKDGGKSNETPLMFDDRASEAAWVLRQTLSAHAVEISALEVGASTADIARRLHELVVHITDPNALEEITSAVDLGLVAIDQPPCRIYLGDCECGSRLYGDPEQQQIECGRCGETHDPKQRRALNAVRGREIPVTATEAAKYLGEVCGVMITASRIRVWAHRGKLNPVGANQDAKPVYRLGDVLDLARNA